MHNQHHSDEEIMRRAFPWRTSALHDIHHALGRVKRRPGNAVRVVYTSLPERKTWYECVRCGSPTYREDSRGKHCRLCGSTAVPYEWVRPDIARADERARRRRAQVTWVGTGPGRGPARYAEITNVHPWKPLPDGEYRIMRKTRGPG